MKPGPGFHKARQQGKLKKRMRSHRESTLSQEREDGVFEMVAQSVVLNWQGSCALGGLDLHSISLTKVLLIT